MTDTIRPAAKCRSENTRSARTDSVTTHIRWVCRHAGALAWTAERLNCKPETFKLHQCVPWSRPPSRLPLRSARSQNARPDYRQAHRSTRNTLSLSSFVCGCCAIVHLHKNWNHQRTRLILAAVIGAGMRSSYRHHPNASRACNAPSPRPLRHSSPHNCMGEHETTNGAGRGEHREQVLCMRRSCGFYYKTSSVPFNVPSHTSKQAVSWTESKQLTVNLLPTSALEPTSCPKVKSRAITFSRFTF